ncbi:MAG TPA: type IV pilus assembly protein PilM [Candidatus Eisenbacteria bacterium]|nr:type IV pilus assembly protein PilM [Candidatus Eisenbacteria bacterium]
MQLFSHANAFKSLKNFNFAQLARVGRRDGYVAFDIGSSSIKMVEATADKNGYRLLNAGVLPLPPGAVQNNMVVDPGRVADAVRKLIQQNGVTASKVISAVPGRAVIMKKFQLPMQQGEELETNVEFEAKQVIPENLENVNLDYQVVNYLDGGNKLEVLMVAVRKEIVNSYTEVIEQAGLTPAIMDVDYFAMETMYETNYEPQTSGEVIGLIHIGARYTSMNVLSNGISTFTGDLPVGGEEFTETLRRQLQISNESAESLKLTGSLDGKRAADVEAMVRPTSESLAEEIRRTLSLYGAVASDEGIRTIYVTGGSAKVPGLTQVLEERLGIPVQLADPFRGFRLGKNIDKARLADLAPQLAVGVGLAVRRPDDK